MLGTVPRWSDGFCQLSGLVKKGRLFFFRPCGHYGLTLVTRDLTEYRAARPALLATHTYR